MNHARIRKLLLSRGSGGSLQKLPETRSSIGEAPGRQLDLKPVKSLLEGIGGFALHKKSSLTPIGTGRGGMIRDRSFPLFPVDRLQEIGYSVPVGYLMGNERDTNAKADVLQGTLILLVLRTLEALGPLHGYGIARRIEQISREVLQLNQGTLYPALLRMEQEGWITSKWGASEKNRKAKFYNITAAGRKRLARETEDWRRMSSIIERFLGFDSRSLAKEQG
jgi:transcriptional regulator